MCDRRCHEIWLLLLKATFMYSSLFVERSWCAFRVSSRSHKPVSKTDVPGNWIFDLLITSSSFSVACTSNALIDGADRGGKCSKMQLKKNESVT